MAALKLGTAVTWTWGAHTAEDKIEEAYTRAVSRTTKGKRLRHNASKEHPAYLVRQGDGDRAHRIANWRKRGERSFRPRPAPEVGRERRKGPALRQEVGCLRNRR